MRGDPGPTRTGNLCLRRALLCPVELRGLAVKDSRRALKCPRHWANGLYVHVDLSVGFWPIAVVASLVTTRRHVCFRPKADAEF